ncbi:MAG: hypothetical protein GX862_04040 [Leucobacter sp.]|jgi:hypothetical protein|nr:hypothetical protein [Leucobacter sp.]
MRSDYLALGGARVREAIDTTATLDFLRNSGYGGGALQQARAGITAHEREPFKFEAIGVNYCDFCFTQLMGAEFDRLDDGRERCVRCSRSVVRSREEFVELFTTTRRMFELAFEITIAVPMQIHMVNAREIARRSGEVFHPTPGVDARVLGFASRSQAGYEINIENGTPALAAITTIAHELTHIWQFSTWPQGMIETRYGAERQLLVTEGMATWAQIQYLLAIKEFEQAERQLAYARQRTDEYGEGFRVFAERYTLQYAAAVGAATPFQSEFPL